MGGGGSKPSPSAKPIQVTELGAGDILLLRQAVRVDGDASLNVNVAKTVYSATSGRYFSAELHHMQHFSHVALVLEHRHKLYVAFMSTGGLECLPARRWFKRLLQSKTEVYVRKLTVPGAHKTKAQRLFKDVLKIAARGVAWQEQAMDSARSAGGAGDISARSEVGGAGDDTSRTQSASIFAHRSDIPPFASLILGKVLARVAAALQEVPPQARLELTRAFNRADADRSGFIEEHEVKDMLCDLKGSAVSNAEATAMKALIDADGDGRISLSELIDGISKIPLTRVPLEHDTEGIVAAEFVAVVYEMAGLLPRRRTHVVNYTKLVPAGAEVGSAADTMSTMGGLRQRLSDEAESSAASVRFQATPTVASGAGAPEASTAEASTGGARKTTSTGQQLPHATRISFEPVDAAPKPEKHKAVLKRGGTDGRILVGKLGTVDKGYATVRRDARKGAGGGFGLALRTFASELEEETHGNIVVIHSGKAPTHHYAPVSFCASADPGIKLEVGSLAAEVPLLLRATDVDD